ncbi:MAG: peptide chain release factor N(5)-glutamine methyltransferase [Lachnospiraceae bacterium]|nr:peptide chain release factor N(5)-glutamine methyltransferase [Lachnospiraceae bacterium]
MTYREIYESAEKKLENAGINDSKTDARLLLEHVFSVDRNHLYLHPDEECDEKKAELYEELVNKRASHIPLQHLTGKADFMGLEFIVNKHVLIPRFDTECVVEEAMLLITDGMKVLDMCTGSGCILISLMKYKNDIEGFGADISEEALAVAKKNAELNGVSARFIKSDLFTDIGNERFDAVISNPPYIKSSEIPGLMEEVRDHDPLIALDGHEDGLYFYREISRQALSHLMTGGKLIFEIGCDQGEAVSSILSDNGYKHIKVLKDLSGNDRVVTCEKGL